MCERKKVAYVLKGYPRISETFIASEIYRLERLGTIVRLFVIKPRDERGVHGFVRKIAAKPFYLPATTSLSGARLFVWLSRHLKDFRDPLFHLLRTAPVSTCRAALAALAQSFRARKGFWSAPRKLYVKEFLQASAIASEILDDPGIGHIHAHFAHGSATVAYLVSRITGKSFSFTAHAKDIYVRELNPSGFLKRKMDAASFVVTCTRANRDHLQGQTGTPVHCLYHGLSVGFRSLVLAHDRKIRRRDKLPELLAVGRLVPKKGLDVFVRACAILRREGVSFIARIVGEPGEQETEIRTIIADLGLSTNVLLEGSMTQSELVDVYRTASVFCLPCRVLGNGDRDGIPNVLLEAFTCRVPVITTAVSGIPELVRHEYNGLLVPPEDPVSLAVQIKRLLTDKALTKRLSTRAIGSLERSFNGDESANLLKGLFEGATESLSNEIPQGVQLTMHPDAVGSAELPSAATEGV